MKNKLKSGDRLIVSDLDRLGRDASNTIVEIKELQSKVVKLVALSIHCLNEWDKKDNDSLHRMTVDILITLKAHMAEQEREKTISHINQGLAVAKENGVKLGVPTDFIKQYERFLNASTERLRIQALLKCLESAEISYINTSMRTIRKSDIMSKRRTHSKIRGLPTKIRIQLEKKLIDSDTYEQIAEHIKELGYDINQMCI